MIYPKKAKLDEGHLIEGRIIKTDKIRLINYDFTNHIKLYIQGLEQQLKATELLSEDLNFIYFGQTLYENLIYDLQKSMKFREEVIRKEITSLKQQLDNMKSIEQKFRPIRPFIKKYIKKKKRLAHYENKLPKLRIKMDTKTKIKGSLSGRDTKKLVRNERKLKDYQTEYEILSQKITEETNKINLERFEWINPIMKEFISLMLSDCYMNQENYHKLDNYQNILAQKQTEDLNERFFLNVKQQSKVYYQGVKPIKQNGSVYKKNVQNNYYYVNGQQPNQQNNEEISVNQGDTQNQQTPSQIQYMQLNKQIQQQDVPYNQNQNYALPPSNQNNQAIPMPPAQQNPNQAIPMPPAQQNPNQAIPLPMHNQ